MHTNLPLYCVDPVDRHKRARATDWMNHLWSAGIGRISWQVLHEFHWNAVPKMAIPATPARW